MTITIPNDAPIAVNDLNITLINTPVNGQVLNNDFDPNGNGIVLNPVIVNDPADGSVTLNPDGTYLFTPDPNFVGTTSFDYQICDDANPSLCDIASVYITVVQDDFASNNKPIANNDQFITFVNTTIDASVIENDVDADGDNLIINLSPVSSTNNGVLVLFPDGTFQYSPASGFEGEDSFEYSICDNGNPILCDTAKVIIDIIPTNTAEDNFTFANEDIYVTREDNIISGDLLANDTDPEGDVQTINTTPILNPQNGTVVINPNGTFEYMPSSDFTGNDQFNYSVCDNNVPQACDTTFVHLTITPINDAPIAIDDTNTTNEDIPVNGTVLPNDFDTENNGLTVNTVLVENPSNGTITINNQGVYTYVPNSNFNGIDTFLYQVCDNGIPSLCDTAKVVITVTSINDVPIAVDDNGSAGEDTPVSGSLITNDTDPDGDDLTITTTPISIPNNGIININANGDFIYTPDMGFNGLDTVEYEVCDNGVPILCDTANLFININSINDAPNASDDAFTTNEDVSVDGNVLPNDSDPENDIITVNTILVENPSNGSVTINSLGIFTHMPNPNYNGQDTFHYEICDSGIPSLCDTAEVIITINSINDAPIAVNDSNTTNEDTPANGNVLPNDSDPDNNDLTVNTNLIIDPTDGLLNIDNQGIYIYTPNPDFNGQDTFQYEICDNGIPSLCDTAEVIITVNSINDAPIAANDNSSTNEDTPVSGILISNDTDPDNDGLTVNIVPVNNPNNGVINLNTNGNFNYTPNLDFNGLDSVAYEVCDNGTPILCDTAILYINVISVNDPPIALDDAVSTTEDVPVNGDVLPNDSDPENDNISVNTILVENPTNGSITINSVGNFTYTPNPNFNGQDTFQYEICDNGMPSLCDTAQVIITINSLNDAPVAIDDSSSSDEDTPVSDNVLDNDFDTEDDNLVVKTDLLVSPTNGLLNIDSLGNYTYTPDPDFNGQDTFQYEICDNGMPSLSDTAEVIITINSINDAPIAINNVYEINEGDSLNENILVNDSDPDGDLIQATTTLTKLPQNGNYNLNSAGDLVYTPAPAFFGQDTLCYEVCDNGTPILCDTAEVIINIVSQNDPPYAINDINVTPENTSTNGNVLDNDFDPDNDELIINTTPLSPVDNGILSIQPDGEYTYTPNIGFTGTDQFTYEICDTGSPVKCATAQAVIEVVGENPFTNDPPIAINDNFVTLINVPISNVNLLTNDFDPDEDNISINITPIDPPKLGTVLIQPNGFANYTPNNGALGEDTFIYEICDDGNPNLCNTGLVTIVIFPNGVFENTTFAGDDAGLTFEDTPLSGVLNDNDSDPEGDIQTLQTIPSTSTSHGAVSIFQDGSFYYVPNPEYSGVDLFKYVTCDDGTPMVCDTATVYLTILSQNDPPIAINDINVIHVNETASGNLLANDFDIEGDNIIINITPVNPPLNGSIIINGDGSYVYTPNVNFFGEELIQYQICDDGIPSKCDTGLLKINIIEEEPSINSSPVAINDVFVTTVNQDIRSSIITNDFDPDEDPISITTNPVSPPSNGSLIIVADGTFNYTPNPNFSGIDEFTYRICDNPSIGIGASLCDNATVFINVIPPNINNLTYANDDVFHSTENSIITGNLLSNDTDPEGDKQIVNTTLLSQPTHGLITLNIDGTFTYIPDPNYYGIDQFIYKISDNGTPLAMDSAFVYLSIFDNNNPPIALEDVNNTILNTPVGGNVLTNDLEINLHNIILNSTPINEPENGTVTIMDDGYYTYSPNQGFIGEDIFTYEICDDQIPKACDTTHVIIEVLTASPDHNNPPNGVEDNVQTYINVPYFGNLISNDYDIDGDQLTINPTIIQVIDNSGIIQPKTPIVTNHGVVEIFPDGTFSYISNSGFVGEDLFKYEVCDNGNPILCDTVLVTIDVIPNPLNQNRIFATDDAGIMWEDQSFSSNLLANDHHPYSHPLTLYTNPVRLPEHGIVSINSDSSYVYTPFNNYYGPDRFLYFVCDNQNPMACDTATVYLTVLPFQDPPIAKADINQTLINTLVFGQVLTNDEEPDGDIMTVSIVPISLPQNGNVTLNADGTYEYMPVVDFVGEDVFSYEVCDENNLCDTATVTIQVIDNNNPVNNPPTGVEDVFFGIVGTPLNGSLTSNDSDPDSDPFNITTTPIEPATNGTLVIHADGTYDYTPNPNFTGVDEFNYEICDLGNPVACDTVKVIIEIFPEKGNTIFANDDAISGNEDTPISGNLVSNDYDPEGNTIQINTSPISLPNHGVITILPNGSFTYLPVADYFGPDHFEYEICDTNTPTACDIATAYITVMPINDTLCVEGLPKPTLLSNADEVCISDEIHLFIQENYPLFTIENTTLNFEFIWFNGLGDTMAITSNPSLIIASDAPEAISPFTVKVKLEDCISPFADPLTINVIQLPNIIATNNNGLNGICKNESAQLGITTVQNATYEWRILGEPTVISTQQNPIISNILTTTTFEVTVILTQCDTFVNATVAVNVNDGPTINPQLANTGIICEGTNFQIESNAVGINPLTYQWSGPNGFSSNASNPIVTNASQDKVGTYIVQVTDNNGCNSQSELVVSSIMSAPEKPIINYNTQVCPNGVIELNVLTQYPDTNTTYNWLNGLGNSISSNRNLSLSASDTLAISPFRLQVEVNGCSAEDSDLINVSIQNTPIAIASSDASLICKGGDVQLYANSIEAAIYEWRILGSPAIISAIQNPVINNVQQTIDYTLTVRGSLCSNEFAIDTISIGVNPSIDFNLNKTYSLNQNCSIAQLLLSANVIGNSDNLSYLWTGPNNFGSTEENPLIEGITEQSNGAYSLVVTDEFGCSTEKTIFINDLKGGISKPEIQATNLVCENKNILLEVPKYEGTNVIYNWFENGGALIGLSSSNQLFIDEATPNAIYNVLIQIGGCLIESDTLAPIVFEQPTVNIAEQLPLLCTDGQQDIALNATIVGGQAPYEINWSGSNGFISYNEDPIIVNATESLKGTYSINVTDQNGCSIQASIELDITDAPSQPIINVPSSICEGDIITLSTSQYEGVEVSYAWSVPNSQNVTGLNTNEIIITPGPTIENLGTYELVVNIDGCSSRSIPVLIDLKELPTITPQASFIINENCSGGNLVLTPSLSEKETGLIFEWTGPNNFVSSVENPIISNLGPENNGQYVLKITNSSGCSRIAATNTINNISTPLPQPIIQISNAVCEGGIMVLTAPIYTGIAVDYTWLINDRVIEGENTNSITIGPLTTMNDEYRLQVQVDECILSSDNIIPNILPINNINPTYQLSGLCEGGDLQLFANINESVGNVSYTWTGPNGFVSNAENPLVTNVQKEHNGTYNLNIQTLSGCETSKSLIITEIIEQPEQPTIITNSPVCSDGLIELSIQETANSDRSVYIWFNGQGNVIGNQRILDLAPSDANAIPPYYAKVSVANCNEISSIPVNVEVIDVSSMLISNNGPVCAGESVQLIASEVEGGLYTWYNMTTGEIVSTEQNPILENIKQTTTFSLELTVGGCNNSQGMQTTVRVSDKPIIINLNPFATICEGQDVILTAKNEIPSDEVLHYIWTGPNGFNFTGESMDNNFPVTIPDFSINQAGTYELVVSNQNNCPSDSRTVVIGVGEDLITPNLSTASNLVCGGESILLTASSDYGSDVSYEWYNQIGNGDLLLIEKTITPTLIISNVSEINSGEYLVRVINGECQSGYSNTIQITVLDVTTEITASNNTTLENSLCEDGVIQLSVPFYKGATYTWFGPAGFTSEKHNPIINPSTILASGDYFAIVSVEGCKSITSSITTVYISPKPEPPTIINNGPICVGESVTLEVSSQMDFGPEDVLVYEWYNAFSNTLIAATKEPSFTINNVKENESGGYYLRLSLNGCPANASNESEIVVYSTNDLKANAGLDQSLCAASEVILNANEIIEGNGIWTTNSKAIITDSNNPQTLVSNLQAGINQFVWTATSSLCSVESIDTVEIMVNILAEDKANAGLDKELCEINTINLEATSLTAANGLWTQSNSQQSQGVVIVEPTNPTSTVNGLEPGNSYSFIWTLSQGECLNFDSDTVQLIINDMPPDNALIRDEFINLCDEDQLTLIAETPTLSIGTWFTTSSAVIADPTSPTTFTEHLDAGQNIFVWALSNGACENYSTDTLIVYSERNPIANDDNYEVNTADSLNLNLLENDVFPSSAGFEIIITKQPEIGSIIEQADGTLTYKPQNNFFGFDNFTYQLCSSECGGLCDSASVTIGVTGAEGSPENCFIPNVISPNNDGQNDVFFIGCIDQSPDNKLKIFNRWGDIVYQVQGYKNDWEGTHNRNPLPAGTYFYLLKLTPDTSAINGFITIFR